MIVKCINNNTVCNNCITINKEYKVISEADEFYVIINDNGDTCEYYKDRFQKVEEFTFQEAIKRNVPGTYTNKDRESFKIKKFTIQQDGVICLHGAFAGMLVIPEYIKFRYEEEKIRTKIIKVEHYKAGKRYAYIEGNDNESIKINEMVECTCTPGRQYGKCVNIVYKDLTPKQISLYKKCYKIH